MEIVFASMLRVERDISLIGTILQTLDLDFSLTSRKKLALLNRANQVMTDRWK